jgi:hypothetical protein
MKQSCKNVKYTQIDYSSGKSEGQDSEIRNKKSENMIILNDASS